MKAPQTLISFILALFLCSFTPAQAQTAFGLKAGVTGSNLLFSTNTPDIQQEENLRFSAHFGYLLRTYVNAWLYFQPELLYIEKGYKDSFLDINGVQQDAEIRFRNINLPLLLGTSFRNFQIAAGPEVEYLIKAHSRITGEDYEENPVFGKNKWLFNANVEMGYQVNRLQLSLRGSVGLNPVLEGTLTDVNGTPVPDGRFNYRNVAMQAAIAYMLFE